MEKYFLCCHHSLRAPKKIGVMLGNSAQQSRSNVIPRSAPSGLLKKPSKGQLLQPTYRITDFNQHPQTSALFPDVDQNSIADIMEIVVAIPHGRAQ